MSEEEPKAVPVSQLLADVENRLSAVLRHNEDALPDGGLSVADGRQIVAAVEDLRQVVHGYVVDAEASMARLREIDRKDAELAHEELTLRRDALAELANIALAAKLRDSPDHAIAAYQSILHATNG